MYMEAQTPAIYEHMESTCHDFLICTKVDNIIRVLYQPRGTKSIIKKSLNKYVIEGDDGKYISISDITRSLGFYIYLSEAIIDDLNKKLCIKIDINPPINITTNTQCGSLVMIKGNEPILYQTVFVETNKFKEIEHEYACDIDEDTIEMLNSIKPAIPITVRIYPTSNHYDENDISMFRMLLSGKDYFMDKRKRQFDNSTECVGVVVKCMKSLCNIYIRDNKENMRMIKDILKDVQLNLQQRIEKCSKLDNAVMSMCDILKKMKGGLDDNNHVHSIFPSTTQHINALNSDIEKIIKQLDSYPDTSV